LFVFFILKISEIQF